MAEQSNGQFDFDHPAVRELAAEMTGGVFVSYPASLRHEALAATTYGDVIAYSGGTVEVTPYTPENKLGSFATVVGIEKIASV